MTHNNYDVCFVLNYYAPYISGLTETARIVAEGLAKAGKKIAVVTTQHHPDLQPRETINGVAIFRTPVAFKIAEDR